MKAENVTILDLMRMTGMSAATIEKAFKEAETHGLVRRDATPLGYTVTLTDPKTGLPIRLPRVKS
jgi:CTP-dependent riboflavin kinase